MSDSDTEPDLRLQVALPTEYKSRYPTDEPLGLFCYWRKVHLRLWSVIQLAITDNKHPWYQFLWRSSCVIVGFTAGVIKPGKVCLVLNSRDRQILSLIMGSEEELLRISPDTLNILAEGRDLSPPTKLTRFVPLIAVFPIARFPKDLLASSDAIIQAAIARVYDGYKQCIDDDLLDELALIAANDPSATVSAIYKAHKGTTDQMDVDSAEGSNGRVYPGASLESIISYRWII